MRRDRLSDDELLDGPARELLPVLLSYFIDDATPPTASRAVGRDLALRILRGENLEDLIADRDDDRGDGVPYRTAARAPAEPDRETWGLLPEHQAGLARAMAIMGPTVGTPPDA